MKPLVGLFVIGSMLFFVAFVVGYGFGFGWELGFQHATSGKAVG